MRMTTGITVEDATKQFNATQKNAFKKIMTIREEQDKAAKQASELQIRLYRSIGAALKSGVPVVVIANAIGMTRARIYQMRDAGKKSKK